jgi:hypothetical protein
MRDTLDSEETIEMTCLPAQNDAPKQAGTVATVPGPRIILRPAAPIHSIDQDSL